MLSVSAAAMSDLQETVCWVKTTKTSNQFVKCCEKLDNLDLT